MEGGAAASAPPTRAKEKEGIFQHNGNNSTLEASSSEVTYTDDSDLDYTLRNGRTTNAVKRKRKRKHQIQYTGRWKGRRIQKEKRRRSKIQEEDLQGPTIPVHCGRVEGLLYKEKLAAGVSHKSIKSSDGKWFTPPEFEVEGGRESWKAWKRSIYYKQFPLKKLIDNGYLPNPRRIYSRRKKVKNPSSGKSAQFQSSTVVCHDGPEEAMPGPSVEAMPGPSVEAMPGPSVEAMPGPSEEAMPGLLEEAMPGLSEEAMPGPSEETIPGSSEEIPPVAPRSPARILHKNLQVVLKRLSSSELPSARGSPPDSPQANALNSPQANPLPVPRTRRCRYHWRRSMEPHTISSRLGFAILHSVRKMKQLFQNTFGDCKALQVKLQDIRDHLVGLRKQHADLKKALDRCSQPNTASNVLALQNQMNGITTHQRQLEKLVLKILATLGGKRS